VAAAFQAIQARMPKKHSMWYQGVLSLGVLDRVAPMQLQYALEDVLNQLEFVIKALRAPVVYVLKEAVAASAGARQVRVYFVVFFKQAIAEP
jgi:hypothetical protein